MGWARDDYTFVVTMRDSSLAEVEPPELLVPDNANRFYWDLAYSTTIFVAYSDTGGEGGAERYALNEYGDDLGGLAEWRSVIGGSERVQRVVSVSVASGTVTFFETSNSDIRTRAVASGANALQDGVTLVGTKPAGALTLAGDVVVAYRTAEGELAVAIVDSDGDETAITRASSGRPARSETPWST